MKFCTPFKNLNHEITENKLHTVRLFFPQNFNSGNALKHVKRFY